MKRPWGIRIRLIFMLLTLLFIPILIFAGVSQLRLNSSMEESLDSRVQAWKSPTAVFPLPWRNIIRSFTTSARMTI